jgi:hypothetical protein
MIRLILLLIYIPCCGVLGWFIISTLSGYMDMLPMDEPLSAIVGVFLYLGIALTIAAYFIGLSYLIRKRQINATCHNKGTNT